MNYKLILVIGSFLYSNFSLSQEIDKKGICILDRNVESFNYTTWLSAKSRALSDIIPIKYNNRALYLGYGEDQNVYIRINGVNTYNGVNADFYKSSVDSSIFMVTTTESKTIIVFSKTDIGPFFLGTCELK